jgi:hypothetical protein
MRFDITNHISFFSTFPKLMSRLLNQTAYRAALALAGIAVLLLVWLSLGVGIIGADGDPANWMYASVVVIGIIGSVVSRMRPVGMTYTLLAMAVAQALILVIALVAGLGQPWSGPLELFLLNGFFIAMFAISGWLFRVQHEVSRN